MRLGAAVILLAGAHVGSWMRCSMSAGHGKCESINYMILKNNCRYVWLAVLALCALACFGAAQAAEGLFPNPTVMAPPQKPTRIPEFDFANLHGGSLKSSELKGKVIIIRFWATW